MFSRLEFPAPIRSGRLQWTHNPKVGGSNPPPATNLKLHAISHLNQILYLAFDWQLNAQNPFAVVSEPLSRIIADI